MDIKEERTLFDFDGDGDIDEFDEELTEYELQLMEDEMLFEEDERRQYQEDAQEEDWGRSCGLGVLIAIGFFVIFYVIITII